MTEKFFVDTNVLVYVHDASQPAKAVIAGQWIDRFWREGSGKTSIQVLKELYATLTRNGIRPDAAWDDVRAYSAWKPEPTSIDLLFRAHEIERRYRINWWDSLIVAAAQFQDCSVLLTEDLQSGMRFDQLTVLNPFRNEVRESRAIYASDLLPRHARPERPRMQAA